MLEHSEYGRHQNVQGYLNVWEGIQTYGASEHMWGIQTYGDVQTYGGHLNVQGVS